MEWETGMGGAGGVGVRDSSSGAVLSLSSEGSASLELAPT